VGLPLNFGRYNLKLGETTMQIKFVIKYSYMPHILDEGKFRAMVTFRVPKETNSDAVAYCYQAVFNGYKISDFSGHDAGEWRVLQLHFSNESFEQLEQELLRAIEEYKSKVSENVKLVIETQCKSTEMVLEFPDSVRVYK